MSPLTAAGQTQFADVPDLSAPELVGAPMAVVAETATTTATLAAGSLQLVAVFLPADASAFGPSLSPAMSYVVNAAAPDSGTMAVIS